MLADDHPLRRLAEQYPACFNLVGHERQPIKIGIGDELAALDTGLTPLQLGRALATYVRHSGYQCNPSRRRPTPRRCLPGWLLSGLAKVRPRLGWSKPLSPLKMSLRAPSQTRLSCLKLRSHHPGRLSLAGLRRAALSRRQAERDWLLGSMCRCRRTRQNGRMGTRQ